MFKVFGVWFRGANGIGKTFSAQFRAANDTGKVFRAEINKSIGKKRY